MNAPWAGTGPRASGDGVSSLMSQLDVPQNGKRGFSASDASFWRAAAMACIELLNYRVIQVGKDI